jgi:flagellar protein FliO/FliZ
MDNSFLIDCARMLAALVFVVALMGGLAILLRRLGLSGPAPVPGRARRLKIVEAAALDGRRRMVLIQRDDVQHLVILGSNSETVIETGIVPKDNQDHD